MKVGAFILCLLVIVCSHSYTNAQDTIIFINGKKVVATETKLADTHLHYNPVNGTAKIKKAEAYNIFSIKHADGTETYIYQQDTLTDDMSLEQMKMFVRGQQDAREYYNPITVTVSSAVIGVGSGLFLQFFALVPPAAFATIVGAATPDVTRQTVSDRELLKSPEYLMGYESRARNIKIKRALIYGIGGALIGYAGFRIKKANEKN